MTLQRFWPGETVRVTIAFTDLTGTAMVPASVVITARRPDGVRVVGTAIPVDGATNAYYADFVVGLSGAWAVRGTCEGPTAAAVEQEFAVAPSLVGIT